MNSNEHEGVWDLETAYSDTDHLKYRRARNGCFVGENLDIIHKLVLQRLACAKLYCDLETRESSMIS